MSSVLLLGAGYSLTRWATRGGRAVQVLASTGNPERQARLRAAGCAVMPLEQALARASMHAATLVSIPPEAGLDARLSAVLDGRPLVYLSSTAVYGSARGEVSEETPAEPDSGPGVARLAAERLWRQAGARVLRLAGIYGPGRSVLPRLRAGALKLPAEGGGRISRVHVDDLCQALDVVLGQGHPGEVYNVADGSAATQRELVDWLCPRLSLPLPGTVALTSLHRSLQGDRAVSSARLCTLGWTPRYPSFREGYAQLIAEEACGDAR